MRLFLLSEATIEDIQRKIPILLSKYFKDKPEQESIEQLRLVAEADPTKGKYVDWLARQLKAGRIRLPEDSDKLKANLERFHKVKNRLEQKDIHRYTPGKLARAIEPFQTSARQEKKLGRAGELVLPPHTKMVLEKGPYQVVKITEPDAAVTLSSGTEWCTAVLEYAQEYLSQGPLYLVYKNGKRWMLAHYESNQFKDVYDDEFDPEIKFKIIDMLEPVTGLSKENDPNMAYEYAVDVIGDRWPEGEEAISKDPEWACDYAKHVIKGRWPEAEETIKKDPAFACWYGKGAIKGRWPEAEETIKKDPTAAYNYAKDVIKGRWPEGEEAIKKYPYMALIYAMDVIKGRWPEGEEIIKKNAYCAAEYAKWLGHK